MNTQQILSLLKYVLALFFALISFGCQSKRPDNVLSLNSSLRLTEEQIPQMETKARQGDAQAAFKLCEHYEYIEHNHSIAFMWLIQAAEGGHAVAQYNLGQEYSGAFHSNRTDLEKAKFWLRKAAENGVKEATEQLEQLELKQVEQSQRKQ